MHEEVLKKIGDRFRELRISKGYSSYEDFAIDNDLGRMQYWRLENGKTNLTIKTLVKVLAIHEISMTEFFSYVEKDKLTRQE